MDDGSGPGIAAPAADRGAPHPSDGPPRDEGQRDEVDGLVAAWRAQRPDLDVEPLQVLSRVSRLARHLDLARRTSFASHGLETWEFDVLSALRRQGPPYQMTPGALIRATLVTSGTMTNRIDRLAEAGLVRRKPDPRDRRGVLVTLTDQGRAKAAGDRGHGRCDGRDRLGVDVAGQPPVSPAEPTDRVSGPRPASRVEIG